MPSLFRRAAALTICAAVIGCAGESTPTAPAAASHDLLGGLVGTVTGVTSAVGLTSVRNLQRDVPLAAPITVSQTIGVAGGILSIPEAGVNVVVPPGAVSAPTDFSMTARAGTTVAYDFEPHGITFTAPLSFTQDLRGTNAPLLSLGSLRLAYYSDPSLLGATTSLVSELIRGVGSVLSRSFTAPIRHFSGYMVTWGCTD
jgi:ZU5 domain.